MRKVGGGERDAEGLCMGMEEGRALSLKLTLIGVLNKKLFPGNFSCYSLLLVWFEDTILNV